MKEDSIEDRIEKKYENDLELTIEEAIYILETDEQKRYVENLLQEAHKVILSDYKRVLKENEELKIKNNAIKEESEAYAENMIRLDNELNLEKEKNKYEWMRRHCLPESAIKKVEKENEQLKKDNEELRETNKKLYETGLEIARQQIIFDNYIPFQKVKDKIEELKEKSGGNVFHIQQTISAEIRLLKELIEERE